MRLENFSNSSSGQTLIETLAAIFILVMGVTAATGLAIYAFNSSNNVTRQIIATGLAREGLEAVKNMRDTNWLKSTPDTNCYNYASSTAFNAVCYKNWLQSPGSTGTGEEGKDFGYSILPSPGNSNTYILVADKDAAHRSWILSPESANFGLDFLGNMADAGFAEFYYPSGSVNGSSDYFRKITITLDPTPPYNHPASAPFNTDIGPKVKVKSQVWWVDNRRCLRGPDRVDYPANGQCAVTLETYLTNWKNY